MGTALEKLMANSIYFLSLAKGGSFFVTRLLILLTLSLRPTPDYSEHLDDELFLLQTRSNSLDPMTSRLHRVERLTALFSMVLFSFQKKVEEIGIFEGYAKAAERVLDPNVDRRDSNPAREEISLFLRRSILCNPQFLDTFSELFPQAETMLQHLCSELEDDDWISKLVCDFIASYHCSSSWQTLASPGAIFQGVAERCQERDIVYHSLALENVLYPFIMSVCMERTTRPTEDARFDAQCSQALKKATQSHFSIRLDLQCKDTLHPPWEDAIREMRSLPFYYAPSEMLRCIYRVSKNIFAQASEMIGGDDFMDILCFVVFKSRLKTLCSLLEFIETFMSDDCDPEQMYYFTCVQLSLSFIQDLNWSKLQAASHQVIQKKRNIRKKMPTILVAEARTFLKRFVNCQRPLFQIIAQSIPLSGYCVYAIREFFDPDFDKNYLKSFRKTIVVRTNDPADKIVVSAVRLIENRDNPADLSDFFGPIDGIENMKMVDTRFGSIQCVEDDVAGKLKTFGSLAGIRVPDGKFNDFEASISDFCTVRQLLWPQMDDLFDLEPSPLWILTLCHEYAVEEDLQFDEKRSAARSIVQEAQVLLKLLSCYPRLAPLDGRLSSQTVFSITKFQEEYDASQCILHDSERDYAHFERKSVARTLFLQNDLDETNLIATGRLNPATLVAMYRKLLYLTLKIVPSDQAGLPADLLLDFTAVSSLIKSYQVKNRIYTSGSFDDTTISKMMKQ